MKISIVIPNYNGEAFLDTCLKSVFKQEYQDFEVIVVDNGSKDRSLEVLKRYTTQITTITLGENYGFSRACNEGINKSSGEFVALLNNDTEVKPFWLQNLVECISKDENIFSCSSKMLRYDDKNLIDDAGDEYNILGWAYKRYDGKDKDNYGTKDISIFSTCAGAGIYRKEVLLKLGGFDEAFFAYLEDVDISYRALCMGYKNIYCSGAEVYHIGSATSGGRYSKFKAELTARNNLLLIYKNMPNIQLLINILPVAVGFLIKLLFYTKKGMGRAYLTGIMQGFKSCSQVKKNRFQFKNLVNYIYIEFLLIKNFFTMFINK